MTRGHIYSLETGPAGSQPVAFDWCGGRPWTAPDWFSIVDGKYRHHQPDRKIGLPYFWLARWIRKGVDPGTGQGRVGRRQKERQKIWPTGCVERKREGYGASDAQRRSHQNWYCPAFQLTARPFIPYSKSWVRPDYDDLYHIRSKLRICATKGNSS